MFVSSTFAVAFTALLAGTASPDDPTKLAVMRLEAQRLPAVTVRVLDELLLKVVADCGLFDVIATDEVNAMLSFEKQKELVGCTDVACFAEIGSSLGVQQLILGAVSKLGNQVIVSLKMVDVRAMTIQRSQSRCQDDENLYEGAIREAFGQLLGTGSLGVASHPEGAVFSLDGGPRGQTPMTIDRLPSGKHLVTLSLNGYEPEQVTVVLRKGEARQIDMSMRLLSGNVAVKTTPNGATCYLDGKPFGETPCEKSLVAIGRHEIEVRREHYASEKTSITVKHKETTPWDVVLIPLPVPVTIGTAPQGASVAIDGAEVGTTEHTAELTPGVHEVEVELTGFVNQQKTVTITAGKPESINFALIPGISGAEQRWRVINQVTKWSLTGLAAVATGMWAWQGLRAKGLERDAQKLHVGTAAFDAKRSDMRKAATVADASLVAVVLAAGGATYFWLTVEF